MSSIQKRFNMNKKIKIIIILILTNWDFHNNQLSNHLIFNLLIFFFFLIIRNYFIKLINNFFDVSFVVT